MNHFKDYFSGASEAYAQYRPDYPNELFTYLASLTQKHETAWDCATGTGQTAKNLSTLYETVIATDASQTQITQAKRLLSKTNNISFKVTRAEDTKIAGNSIDLLTVSQAMHWFDLKTFSAEVDRVLRPGGVLAVWAYDLMTITPSIDKVVSHLYGTVLDGYWPLERKMIENGYRDIVFPLKQIRPPTFKMQHDWDLPQLLNYLQTWSSVRKQLSTTGGALVETEFNNISKLWGATKDQRTIEWPLVLKVWCKE